MKRKRYQQVLIEHKSKRKKPEFGCTLMMCVCMSIPQTVPDFAHFFAFFANFCSDFEQIFFASVDSIVINSKILVHVLHVDMSE